MTVSDAGQAKVFLLNILFGIICVVIFDFFRALRRRGGKNSLYENVIDAVSFGCIFFLLLFVGVKYNFGAMRYYQIMGLCIGAFLNILLLSRFEVRFFEHMLSFFAATGRFGAKAALFPLLLIVKILAPPLLAFENAVLRFCAFLRRKSAQVGRKRLKNKKIIKKRMKML